MQEKLKNIEIQFLDFKVSYDDDMKVLYSFIVFNSERQRCFNFVLLKWNEMKTQNVAIYLVSHTQIAIEHTT